MNLNKHQIRSLLDATFMNLNSITSVHHHQVASKLNGGMHFYRLAAFQ